MPRDIEHIVATHQLAQQRRSAGKPVWTHTLDLRDVYHCDELGFVGRRDAIAQRIKASRWYQDRDAAGFDEFGELIDDLARAEDQAEFNEYFDAVYDRADYDRVWIKTR